MAEVKNGGNGGAVHLMGMRVENFCKVTLSEIAPHGKSVDITGKNRQGKTSNVNALWWALGGPVALTDMGITKPVREGADIAKAFVDMDEILVYREVDVEGKTKLLVTTREGFELKPGQTVLNTYLGKFFDLSQFYRMEPEKRLELVLSLIDLGGLDLKEWKAARDAVFMERRDVNRDLKALEAQLKAAPEVEAPDAEVSVDDILAEQALAQEKLDDNNAQRIALNNKVMEHNRCKERIEDANHDITAAKSRIEELEKQLAQARHHLSEQEAKLTELNTELETIKADGKALHAEVQELVDPDMTAYSQRISDVERINVRVRAKKARAELAKQVEAKQQEADALTLKLTAFDRKKEKAIKEADFPVPGMGFDDTDITYNDMPFSQSSDMERLVVGYGIAKKLSPKFRVMRLSRPGDLDPENLAALYDLAEHDGIQILTEQVSAGDGGGLVIEDGMLDGGTTEGVQKIMELAKPKRQQKAEAKAAAAETVAKVATDEELEAIYEDTVKAKGTKAKTVKAASTGSTKEAPAAAPVEL